MKYIKSSRGYYYKEFSNGKRIRVSAEEYNTKKQKFKNEQEGGQQNNPPQPPQSPQRKGSSVIQQETLQNVDEHTKDLAIDANNDKEKKQIKKEAIEKKELEEKKRKKRLRFRQDIANELAQAIILMS